MRQRECLIVVLISVLMVGCNGANSQNAGSGAALRVNFTEAAKSADARTRAPSNPDVVDPGT